MQTRDEFVKQNAAAALAWWKKEVPRDHVRLAQWQTCGGRSRGAHFKPRECGSAACFGGWLPHCPYFAELGVFTAEDGSPAMHTSRLDLALLPDNSLGWGQITEQGVVVMYDDLSRYLFGTHSAFSTRGIWDREELQAIKPPNTMAVSDHWVVVMRLENLVRTGSMWPTARANGRPVL